MYKLGIDVGGTNTDAVIIDENYNVTCNNHTHNCLTAGKNVDPSK